MIQFFRRMFDLADDRWENDILQHPALAHMDARQIADLPMPQLATPDAPAQTCRQRNGAPRGGSAATSIWSGGRPARARSAIAS